MLRNGIFVQRIQLHNAAVQILNLHTRITNFNAPGRAGAGTYVSTMSCDSTFKVAPPIMFPEQKTAFNRLVSPIGGSFVLLGELESGGEGWSRTRRVAWTL